MTRVVHHECAVPGPQRLICLATAKRPEITARPLGFCPKSKLKTAFSKKLSPGRANVGSVKVQSRDSCFKRLAPKNTRAPDDEQGHLLGHYGFFAWASKIFFGALFWDSHFWDKVNVIFVFSQGECFYLKPPRHAQQYERDNMVEIASRTSEKKLGCTIRICRYFKNPNKHSKIMWISSSDHKYERLI